MSDLKLYFYAHVKNEEAVKAQRELKRFYGGVSAAEEADVIVCLGGDGTMLQIMQIGAGLNKPIFGMNFGHVGALLNPYALENLPERIAQSKRYQIPALKAIGHTREGRPFELRGFNEVCLEKQKSSQEADLTVVIGGLAYRLRGNGFLVSTPLGSTAYKAHGYPLSLRERLLALTCLSARFVPEERNAVMTSLLPSQQLIVPDTKFILVQANEGEKRPVAVNADHASIKNVLYCNIVKGDESASILFDPEKPINHQDKIIKAERIKRIENACTICPHNKTYNMKYRTFQFDIKTYS